MKRKILIALAMVATLCCFATTKQALILHMQSGPKIVYYLDSEPRITFEGQQMIVHVGAENDEIPMADVDQWEIGNAEFSGIESAEAENIGTITIDGQFVTVDNPANAVVAVYDMHGRQVGTSTQTKVQFHLEKGIYIITIANKPYKILAR